MVTVVAFLGVWGCYDDSELKEGIEDLNSKYGSLEERVAALEDLNELRRNRYDTRNVAYNPVDFQTADELYAFYQSERRRELCFEDHR